MCGAGGWVVTWASMKQADARGASADNFYGFALIYVATVSPGIFVRYRLRTHEGYREIDLSGK
jgi:hypothetical protein